MTSLLLYEDKPAYSTVLKVVIVLVPGLLLFNSLFFWSAGDMEAARALLIEALIIILIFWLVFPRSYKIYEDHIRIALGGPLSVKVGFDNVKAVRVSSNLSFGVNFATAISRSYVEIVKVRGARIAITPKDRESFVDNASRALEAWKKERAMLTGR